MRRTSARSWAPSAALLLIAVGVGASIALGLKYGGEVDYWIVGLPTIATAVGTIGLAGATFRLIQRENEDRSNTLEALKHSQIIAEQSQTSALEAARQRRDARARRLRVTPWQNVMCFLQGKEPHQHVDDGRVFDLPKDANLPLTIQHAFQVLPADDEPMTVTFNGLAVNGEEQAGTVSHTVPFRPPFSNTLVWLAVRRSVSEWVAIAQQRESGDPGPEPAGWVGVDDTYDDGVIDSYELIQAGCPLRKSPDLDGRWVLDAEGIENGFPRVIFTSRPTRRSYYRSKIANEPLA